jgi:hypothetical protein
MVEKNQDPPVRIQEVQRNLEKVCGSEQIHKDVRTSRGHSVEVLNVRR